MTDTAIREFIRAEYGIEATLTRLAGENENYLVRANDGTDYVLKLADDGTTTAMIEMESLAVNRLMEEGLSIGLPRVIPTLKGKNEARANLGKDLIRGRLISFVAGKAWCETLPASTDRLEHLGGIIGKLARILSPLSHPAGEITHHWDLSQADQHRPLIPLVREPERIKILEKIFLWFEAIFIPVRETLPRGPIHGDINDDNVLVQADRVSGLLDFGDCIVNPVICDLAIALAYHTLDEADPLGAAAVITGAYDRERTLSPDEIRVLFPLLCARLAVSVIISAQRRQINPERSAWFVSEERAWKKLEHFSGISPDRAAAGLASQTSVAAQLNLESHQGQAPEHLARERKDFIAPSLSLSYKTPLKFVRGLGQYLFDHQGQPFLDLYNNVCHVGHCHPHVVSAGQAQMAVLNTNTRYLYDGLTEYARRLTATLPRELSTCFFVNSGSEANELALRMAKTVTGREDVLVVDNAYHGHTQTMVQISPYKFKGKGGKGKPEPWVHVVPVADGYRGQYKGHGPETGRAYGDEVKGILDKMDRPPAAFITESLLSCGGQVIPPQDYFKTAFSHVRNAGGLCICDEVQTGFGRSGTHFWAFETQGVVPDIVVMGKPMGNGHPMAAVVTTKEIAQAFANGMEFFATFGGNPVSCAIGMAVLDVIEKETLQEHARIVGGRLLKGLTDLMARHEIIGDVRGTGLFIGVELVKDRQTLAPATQEANRLVNALKESQILLGTDGPFDNVIKFKPPMVMSEADADMTVRVMDRILEQGL